MTAWECQECGFVFDEGEEGMLFLELPEEWVCPACEADKAAFSFWEGAKQPPSAS